MIDRKGELSFFINLILLSETLVIFSAFGRSSSYGLEKITSKNYDSKILNSEKDAWILAVKNVGKISLQEWMELEFNLRGLFVRVGIIDPQKDGAFLKRKGFLDNMNSFPLARVFPFGGWKVKVAEMKDVQTLKDARKIALQSLPDETTQIKNMKELENFVHSSYGTTPPRFPILLFTEKRQTSSLYRSLALKYSTYFNFGVVRKPSTEFLQRFSIEQLPSFLVMLSTMLPNDQLTFSSIPYDLKSYGAISYLTVSKFIYSVHEKHWKELPNITKFKGKMTFKEEYLKDTKAILSLEDSFKEKEAKTYDQPEVREITYKNYKVLCGDETRGLCLTVFLDGSDNVMMKDSIQKMNDVQKILDKDTPVQYLWVNATCHPEYGDVFGIFPETLPTLLITKPQQRLFTTLTLKTVTPGDIGELVTKTLQGKSDLQRYARFNDMVPLDCLTSHGNKNMDSRNNEL